MLKELFLALARINALNIGCEVAHFIDGRPPDYLWLVSIFATMTVSWYLHIKL